MVKRHALEPLKAAVGLERLGKLDDARHVLAAVGQGVSGDAAHGSQTEVSAAADSRRLKASTCRWGEKHALQLAERAVGLESVAESDEATHLAVEADPVVGETVKQKASTVSGC